MKKLFLIAGFLAIAITANSQNIYITKAGQVAFYSKTPLENIDGVNNEVSSILNTSSGEIVFTLLVKSFHFERALLEEHFNENYMESSKIPKATFKGKITNLSAVNFNKEGNYTVSVEGDLTLHGVTQKITAPGTITIKAGKINAVSSFKIKIKDYGIKIPTLVADKIAEVVEIKVNCLYEQKK
ncbi:MAG: hypothetical protein RLZZ316_2196 [Bacteroidota bacterium]|jgi:polyisoprenoid-binding protein YceI